VDFRKHFPYPVIRASQEELLAVLGREWDNYEVFSVVAPTGFGKSPIAKSILDATQSCSYIAPTNQLVDQFLAVYPETPTLSRLDSYYCSEWRRPCPAVRGKLRKFCAGCPCGRSIARTKHRRGPGVYNYHIYTSHKIYRDVLVLDEAHNAGRLIQERMGVRLWYHDYKYPRSRAQLLEWLRKMPPSKLRTKKLGLLHQCLTSSKPTHVLHYTTAEFSGKGTRRGHPEERECIDLLPVDVSDAPPIFWPGSVRKVVLLSATINQRDVQELGLNRGRRVLYIECQSPIPPENRPVIVDPVASINHSNLAESTEQIARYIQDELLPHHTGEKGLVHATYEMSGLLRKHLTDPRFIFHDQSNKKQQYELFRKSPPEEGRVLVACGMYEGIDLPGDAGRWQVIAKTPWLSLADPAVAHKAETDPDYYLWETLRVLIQAAGRICRGEEDHGVTYIPDETALRLLEDGKHLIPKYFSEALILPEEK
jgi:hypothetical protein